MIPWFKWTSFLIGPVKIQIWGLFVAIGISVAVWIIWYRSKKLGEDAEKIADMLIWVLVLGFIFSRLFHVFFYDPQLYLSSPVEILKIWQGGLSSFGGVFGAGVGFFLYIKQKNLFRKKFLKILDIFSFGAVYGWIISRIGCFFIHDHLGIKSNFFLSVKHPEGSRLDMAFLEIIGMLPLAVLFFIFRNKEKKEGWFLSILFIYYGLMRFFLDFFRASDIMHADARYLGLTPAQYFSVILIILGLFVLKKKK